MMSGEQTALRNLLMNNRENGDLCPLRVTGTKSNSSKSAHDPEERAGICNGDCD